jgi:hypothetical protein
MSIANYHRLATKMLVSAAIVLGPGLWGAAPASADRNSMGTDPNPFGTLSCSCPKSAPADGPALTGDIDRGLREGLSAVLPGLPAPGRPGQPRS